MATTVHRSQQNHRHAIVSALTVDTKSPRCACVLHSKHNSESLSFPSRRRTLVRKSSVKRTKQNGGANSISAQILTLPRPVANGLNLAQPVTVNFKGRTIVVPASCVSLTLDCARILLPPNTISFPRLPPPLDLSTTTKRSREQTAAKTPTSKNPKKLNLKRLNSSLKRSRTRTKVSVAASEYNEASLARFQSNVDCMLYVFSYLGPADLLNAAKVSRHWNNIARHKSLVC